MSFYIIYPSYNQYFLIDLKCLLSYTYFIYISHIFMYIVTLSYIYIFYILNFYI